MNRRLQIVRLILWVIPAVTFPVTSQSEEGFSESVGITLGTWNLSNLASDEEGVQPRNFDDFRVLASYARSLRADVVAVQEVADEKALRAVFGDSYVFHLSDRNSSQRTGFAVHKNVEFAPLPDFVELATRSGLPYGAQIELVIGGQKLKLMSVHLKSGCIDEKSEGSIENKTDCTKLEEQISILSKWLDQTVSETDHFIILGDFNRRLTDRDGDWILDELEDIAPIVSAMRDHVPLCWPDRQEHYTDHFLLSEPVQDRMSRNSFREVTYAVNSKKSVTDDLGRELLYPSDHCPITIELEW